MGDQAVSLVTQVLADVPSVFSTAVNTVCDNAVGAVFVGFAVLGAGITAFRKIRH